MKNLTNLDQSGDTFKTGSNAIEINGKALSISESDVVSVDGKAVIEVNADNKLVINGVVYAPTA